MNSRKKMYSRLAKTLLIERDCARPHRCIDQPFDTDEIAQLRKKTQTTCPCHQPHPMVPAEELGNYPRICNECELLITHKEPPTQPPHCRTCYTELANTTFDQKGICRACNAAWLLTMNSTAKQLIRDTSYASDHNGSPELITAAAMLMQEGRICLPTATPIGGNGRTTQRQLINHRIRKWTDVAAPELLSNAKAVEAFLQIKTQDDIVAERNWSQILNASGKIDDDRLLEMYNRAATQSQDIIAMAPLHILNSIHKKQTDWNDARRYFTPSCATAWNPHKWTAPKIHANKLLLPFRINGEWHVAARLAKMNEHGWTLLIIGPHARENNEQLEHILDYITMNTTLVHPRHQLDGQPDVNHHTRTNLQPILHQLPNDTDSGIHLLATAPTLMTSADPHEIKQRLDRLMQHNKRTEILREWLIKTMETASRSFLSIDDELYQTIFGTSLTQGDAPSDDIDEGDEMAHQMECDTEVDTSTLPRSTDLHDPRDDMSDGTYDEADIEMMDDDDERNRSETRNEAAETRSWEETIFDQFAL